MVADGARDDLTRKLLADRRLPNIQKHVVDRGCYRTALTVFPSTTGPAHIPFVCGLHPGTANIPGYRWLDRDLHDRRRRSIYRHRSLNSPRGLWVGRDMDPDKSLSLYEYFEKPSSVLELIDYCPNQRLSKVIARRLWRIVQAHHSDDWSVVDRMVERLIIRRIEQGSRCIVGSFFGIDEYSHLHSPSDPRTIAAYEFIDRAVGQVADTLTKRGIYDETILAVVSDHGLSATHTHIPLVDVTRSHGFDPYYYPKAYRRRRDSAVLESGNAMAQIYFKRGDRWGEHWRHDELMQNGRTAELIDSLIRRDGVTFVASRLNHSGVIFQGARGSLRAAANDGYIDIASDGVSPLGEHPLGRFTRDDLFHATYDSTYPDAVNQLLMLFSSLRSGDLAVSSEPGFDLRLQYEDPEHHSSHGSLHREHMHVPLALSVPITEQHVSNCDLVPTLLYLAGKREARPTDGRRLAVANHPTDNPGAVALAGPLPKQKSNTGSVLVTLFIIIAGIVLSSVFSEDIRYFGERLLVDYGQDWLDVILFLLTAVSSTPLVLPVWPYAVIGVSLGYNVVRLASVMAVGSATGSFVTFLLGRFFGKTAWMKRRFPDVLEHPWTRGKSRLYVTLILFLGTASPIPCDVLYAACGVKRYPILLFWVTMVAARFVRYIYLGYGFVYFREFFDWLM